MGRVWGRVQRGAQEELRIRLRLVVVAPDLAGIGDRECADDGQLDAGDDLQFAQLVQLCWHVRPERHHCHHTLFSTGSSPTCSSYNLMVMVIGHGQGVRALETGPRLIFPCIVRQDGICGRRHLSHCCDTAGD